jgi:polyketide synthase PksJ
MDTRECASNGAALKKLIDDYHVSIIQATPTTWKVLCAAGWEGNESLKILCGGEALSQDLAKKLLKRCKCLYNMYGPTETTVWSTFHNVTDATDIIPIGKPIANTIACVVDRWGNICSLGTWGELYIGGAGVSKGYHNREDLTKVKFPVTQLFCSSEQRFYSTGDICRLKNNGILECAGRLDNQIKVRGYRIELEEIEKVIETYPEVSNAAVIVYGEQDSAILVAFVVMQPGKKFDSFKLKSFLVSKLPEYMVPVRFVTISSIPMTPNKKVDRKYLSTITIPKAEIENKDLCKNEVEKKLIEIWTDILHLEVSSIDVNFFDAGGNSLLLLTYGDVLLKKMDLNISATTLFQYPTIRSLSQHLRTKGQSNSLAEKNERISLQRKALQAAANRRK